jgi:hypothetical protein
MAKGTGILVDPETWDLKTEIRRDDDGRIIQGIAVGNTLYQDQAFLLKFHPGEIKGSPTIGVGIEDALNGEDSLRWEREIIEQAKRMDMSVERVKLDIEKGELIFKATYR